MLDHFVELMMLSCNPGTRLLQVKLVKVEVITTCFVHSDALGQEKNRHCKKGFKLNWVVSTKKILFEIVF